MLDYKIHRGDIFWIRQDSNSVGSEIRKNRPGIIVSNDRNNTYSETVEIVYLTTAEKKPMPTHIVVNAMGKQSTALCECVYTVDKTRLENYYCTLTEEEAKAVDDALLVSLGLVAPPYQYCKSWARCGKGFRHSRRVIRLRGRVSCCTKGTRYIACTEGNLRKDLRRRASALAESC